MDKIILASGSPRRKEILKRLQIPFQVVIPDIHEEQYLYQNSNTTSIVDLVKTLAEKKVLNAVNKLKKGNHNWVLGVDTLVTMDNQIFGKPKNRSAAEEMLKTLSGRTHEVISGIALLSHPDTPIQSKAVISEVKFKEMSEEEIIFYLNTAEWEDAAGAYKIQERASLFIEWIKGSYSNIVGLPISVFYVMLRENDYNFNK